MFKSYIQFFAAIALVLFTFFATAKDEVIPVAAKNVADRFSEDRMRADVQFLSDDLLEGRGTGQRGGDIAAAYIANQFAMAGLKPAGEDGTYFQKVPLVGIRTQPESELKVVGKGDPITLKFPDDFFAGAETLQPEQAVAADLVFVGYGIVAPEFGWNDYEGVDVKGKVVLALVNDPPSTDPNFFGGKAMTYYGRWTYKWEEATRQKAAGILLIHNTEMASYGWNVIRSGGERTYFKLKPEQYALPMTGWITEESGGKIATAAGQDLADLFKRAATKGFKPVSLPLRVEGKIVSKVRDIESSNVAGLLEGSDPKTKDEAIIFSAHYDHLGIDPALQGDQIFNGAYDNATGTAIILEMARAFGESDVRPSRSMVFLAVTAEEKGLRGSEYYGKNPTIPAKKTMLGLNYDGINLLGEVKDVVLTGADRTSVWPIVQEVARELNLKITPEEHPEAGYYYRSDHFSFARVGIPAFSIDPGNEIVGKPADYGEKIYKEYNEKHYHQPSDEYDPKWDFSAGKQAARLGIYLGWRVAETPGQTGWRPGDEFEKARK